MAQLKDSVIMGNLRVTNQVLSSELQTRTINAPTESNGTTYGAGTSGQVLKSNGSSAYWGTDSTVTVSVTQGTLSFTTT